MTSGVFCPADSLPFIARNFGGLSEEVGGCLRLGEREAPFVPFMVLENSLRRGAVLVMKGDRRVGDGMKGPKMRCVCCTRGNCMMGRAGLRDPDTKLPNEWYLSRVRNAVIKPPLQLMRG